MAKLSQKRIEMGEEKWAEYQKKRRLKNVKKYYELHPDVQKRKRYSVVSCRAKKKRLLVDYKGGKCEHCGFQCDVMSVYDFHHKDPSVKDFGISSSSGNGKSLEKAKQEVDKCLLLCRNCHAIEHHRLSEENRKNKLKDMGW